MIANDFRLMEQSTPARNHHLSSTWRDHGGKTILFTTALRRKHSSFFFLLACTLRTGMQKLQVTRNPLGCSAGLPMCPRSSFQCLGLHCAEETATWSFTVSGVGGPCIHEAKTTGLRIYPSCNPVISQSSHEDDGCQAGKGTGPSMPIFH